MNIPSSNFSATDILCIISSLLQAKYLSKERLDTVSSLQPSTVLDTLLHKLTLEQLHTFIQEAKTFFGLENCDSMYRDTLSTFTLSDFSESIYQRWQQNPVLCFHSSGSTGVPVKHSYPIDILEQEAYTLAPYFTQCKNIVTLMPTHHIFGCVFSLFLPKYLAATSIHLPPLPVAAFFATLRPYDLVLAFPFFWHSLLQLLHSNLGQASFHFPKNIYGISSTAPCPQPTIEGLLTLATTNPLAEMTEIYGSTETSAIGISHNGSDVYSLLPMWERVRQSAGIGIRRIRSNGGILPVQYIPDTIRWESSTRFTVLGRKDHAVQVGGINVYPKKIADILRTHPAVQDCTVRLMRPEEGARLKALLVLTDLSLASKPSFMKDFKQWLYAQLDTASCPKSITLAAQLPYNSMGKLSDW